MKILAIDYGTKKIGFAMGDLVIHSSVPLEPLVRNSDQQVVAHILELVEEYGITLLLVGYPLHMDGRSSSTTRMVEKFTAHLRKELSIAVELFDERLSTFEAEELLQSEVSHFRKTKRKGIRDSVAAWLFLKDYMEKREK